MKKTVIFKDGVLASVIDAYIARLEAVGISVVMRVPFIKGVVLRLPDSLSSLSLTQNILVKAVVDDLDLEVPTMSASGEGGAGEGGAGEGGAGDSGSNGAKPLIQPFAEFDEVPSRRAYRPWGTLHLYEQPYDPLLYLDRFRSKRIPDLLQSGIQGARGIKVAVFDTGIDYTHDKLSSVQAGIDLVNFKPGVPMDDNGHGTHVAGTVAGTNLGVANGVDLYAVKILDSAGSGESSNIVMGLQWAVDNAIDIVNMSVAFRKDNLAVNLAVKAAHEAGIVMVAAAGNFSNWVDDGASGEGGAGEGGAAENGPGGSGYSVMYPAAYPEVIAIGAMDSYQQLAWFSNTGPEVDVLAPGVNVVSTAPDNHYGIANGTSMSAPHATGAVALMLGLARHEHKLLRPEGVKRILWETAPDGVLDLVSALNDVLLLPDASNGGRLLRF